MLVGHILWLGGAASHDTMESEMPISGLLVFTLKNVHLARFTFFQIYFIFFCLYIEYSKCVLC